MNNFIIIFVLISVLINNAFTLKQFKLFDADTELVESIKIVSPEFASSLKRRFTNVGVSEEIRTTQLARPSIIFDDTCFSDNNDQSQIILKNLSIHKHPIARMNEIIPNLLEKNLKISVDWYNVLLKGSYEMINISQLLPMPVKHCGNIIIKLETIKAEGLVGFSTQRDAFKTTNFDLDFSIDDEVDITTEYFDCEAKSETKTSTIKTNIDHTFVKHLKRDLYWKLQETLRTRLNHVLLDFSVVEIFNENLEMSEKYVKRGFELDKLFNEIIDDFFLNAKQYIISHGYANLMIPDFKKDFSKRFGLVTFWGAFEAKNGTIFDLSRIKRISDFSFSLNPKANEITIFGSLGLEELKLHYNRYYAHVWNIGPWGDLKASVGNNALSFKVITKMENLKNLNISFKEFKLKIVQLENIKVEATGMSVILNWLLSYIITWITGHFKQDIMQTIEKQLTVFLENTITKQKLL